MAQGMTTKKQARGPAERDDGDGPMHPLVLLRERLDRRKTTMEREMARGINIDAQIGAAIALVGASKQLMNCTQESIIASVYEANRLGLSLHPSMKHAYLVPFGRKAQLIIDYRGYLAKATEAGILKDLDYELVYAEDHYRRRKRWVGSRNESVIEFEPREDWPLEERGEIRGVLVEFVFPDDSSKVVFLPTERIERIRKAAPSARGSSPWDTHWEEMAAKTAMKWGFKRIPMNAQLADVVAADDHLGTEEELRTFTGETIELDPETGEVLGDEDESTDEGDDSVAPQSQREESKTERLRRRSAQI
jgi:recombination protein RecT